MNFSFDIQSSTTSNTNQTITHIVSIDWQNEQCKSFSDIRNDYFPMRDRLRLTDKKYKSIRLKNANNYWKFCFGDDIPYQSSLEINDQTQNQFPTMMKMISLTQVLFFFKF